MSDDTPVPVGVPQTPTKAQVGAAISTIGGILTALVASVPDNDNVQLWGGLALGLLTVVGTYFGVYQVPNKAKAVDGAARRNHHGAVNWIMVIAICVLFIAAVVLFSLIDVDRDKDGKRGLDWERAPISKTFESSH